MQRFRPVFPPLLLKARAQRRVRRDGGRLPAFEQRPDVLPRAADKQRQSTTLVDALDRLVRALEEVGERPRRVRLDDADEVMRDGGELLVAGRGRADAHAASDLARVGGDDLDRQPLGDGDGRRRLA